MEYLKADQARGNPNAAVSRPGTSPARAPDVQVSSARPRRAGAGHACGTRWAGMGVAGWAGAHGPCTRALHVRALPTHPPTPWLQQEHTARVMAVWKKYKCNPMKSLGGMFVQAPIFIGFFTGLRALAEAKVGTAPGNPPAGRPGELCPCLRNRQPRAWRGSRTSAHHAAPPRSLPYPLAAQPLPSCCTALAPPNPS